MVTKIGDNCLLMVGVHVAHDIIIGNSVILANNVLLGGHVIIEDNVIIGGGSAVHQFVRIGEASFIGGMSGVGEDIVPYVLVAGIRKDSEIQGVNLIGLKRKGLLSSDIRTISECYQLLFDKSNTLKSNLQVIKSTLSEVDSIKKIITFVEDAKDKPIFSRYKTK